MFLPQVDVCERPTEIVILVEMPGVDRKDVRISWKENVLIVAGHKRQRSETGARYMCVERNYGPFRREIAISIPINHKNAKAELRDGLMRIHLPKMAEGPERSSIPIE
jgi:HSP20 family protein